MVLTRNQCDLLISMFNESIQRAKDSGIPIAVECYEDIDRNMSESEMLYNLIEMEKDMLKDAETIEDRNRINTLIELFQALGIKPIEI